MKVPEIKMPTVASKLTGIFKPKPVFNQPVNTEKRYHISRTLYLTGLVLLLGLSTATVILKAITINFIEDNRNTGFIFETGDEEPTVLAALPRNLHRAPPKLALVAGAVSLFVAIGHLIFVAIDWKKGKRTQAYAFRRNVMFIHFMNSIIILFALVSLFVTHKSTSHFSERYIMRKADRTTNEGVRYNIGTFDLETWACELKTVDGAAMVKDDYTRQCSVEEVGRGIMIPLMIIAFVLSFAGIADMMKCRKDANDVTMKTEDVDAEMSKFNAI
ncbi:hypothetical protein B0J11DRAFT_312480 [Dendryphion nanum]|uniref:Uncharacterized protein n=1 Tax=Dendryphion nanum TaxID=256645 RepID=A0A9P9DVB4_9PLEO|nr:hypothetical protein B0J11DRAFT_312480 [Dendryphion nanum]